MKVYVNGEELKIIEYEQLDVSGIMSIDWALVKARIPCTECSKLECCEPKHSWQVTVNYASNCAF